MTVIGIVQVALFVLVLLALIRPLGEYMARVYEGKPPFELGRVFGPVERGIYRLCGTGGREEMGWKTYALAVLLFNLFGMLAVYVLQRA